MNIASGGVAGVQGMGQDPINALQNLTRQPLPAGMVQPGLFKFATTKLTNDKCLPVNICL